MYSFFEFNSDISIGPSIKDIGIFSGFWTRPPALQCSKTELKILNLILSITRQFFRLKLIQKDIHYDLKFHQKPSYNAKTPYF